MNYKKLFWWHIVISAVWGFGIGFYRAMQQEQIKRRMANNPLSASKAFQEVYGHYHNKETDFPEWVNTDEEAKFNNIVARINHPTNRQK